MIYCKYCSRHAINERSNQQHEIRCKSNPDAIVITPSYGMLGKVGSNQYIKGTAKQLTSDTRRKMSEASKRTNAKLWSDPQLRKKHSEAMKNAVLKYPESYTSSNRGRTKQIIYKNIKFHGTWELDFYKWCEENDVECHKNVKGFPYCWNGNRTYFPDFYLPSRNTYIEVKGYKTEQDEAKWQQFPENLVIIDKKDIYNIRNKCYNL